MENVKKCRNFLSTLIKLASTGKQSAQTAENVKELVKELLVRELSSLQPAHLNLSQDPFTH
jgi:transcription initiation factor TFIID subunit 4